MNDNTASPSDNTPQQRNRVRHLDLFAGIGGFSLAASWTGVVEPAGFVEIDPWCRRVLAKHWPGAPMHDDIKTLTGDALERFGSIDLITGGYPCQPFSLAGQRRGADDDRHLWPHMRRVIDQARPRFILAENVAGHISMGLDTVLAEMEADGYTAGAVVVPAGAVNALHRRDRIWIMAHAGCRDGERGQDITGGNISNRPDARWAKSTSRADQRGTAASNPDPHGKWQPQPKGTDAGLRGRSGDLRAGWKEQRGAEPVSPEHAAAERMGGEASVADPNGSNERSSGIQADAFGNSGDAWQEVVVRGMRERGPDQRESQTAWPVDIGADGVSSGLVRRSATGPSDIHPDDLDDYYDDPEWSEWINPDLIRKAWANGSWEVRLPRVVTDEPERGKKLMAAGNAVVPLVAYEILRVMLAEEEAH